jgi:hypothetical protein
MAARRRRVLQRCREEHLPDCALEEQAAANHRSRSA